MDDFLLFWGVVLLVAMILFFGIPLLVYFLLKRIGNPKVARVFGIGTLFLFISFFIYVFFEDNFFFKSSAKEELKEMNIVLKDDFEILKNESGGFTDFYHVFVLEISKDDVSRLIDGKRLVGNPVIIAKDSVDINILKKIELDKYNRILTYEYIIN